MADVLLSPKDRHVLFEAGRMRKAMDAQMHAATQKFRQGVGRNHGLDAETASLLRGWVRRLRPVHVDALEWVAFGMAVGAAHVHPDATQALFSAMVRVVVEAALKIDITRARQFYEGLGSDGPLIGDHGESFVDGVADWVNRVVEPYPDDIDDDAEGGDDGMD